MNNCIFDSLCSRYGYALQQLPPARPAARKARMTQKRFELWH